jgi:hypothetical protein
MPREGTKAAEIMRLYAEGLSTSEIAKAVGCRPEYVRVVARQRKGSTESANDRTYRARVYKHGNRRAARIDGRLAYAIARAAGQPENVAKAKYIMAWNRTMRRTAHA